MADLHIEPASFWFVWTKTGRVPRFAHDTLEGAQQEAIRLARQHPGQKFIVLEATNKFWVPAVMDGELVEPETAEQAA